MGEIASTGQLRLAYLRWALVTVPGIVLLGFAAGRLVPLGAENRWYTSLVQPAETPPDWVFPVAWSIIYILLGLALAIVLNARGSRYRGLGIGLFVAQMIPNLLWTPLFFGAHKIWLALFVLIAMFVLAFATTLVFGRIRALAAWAMVPYLVWLCWAGMLNYKIGQLNPNAETLVPSASSTQIQL